jgi:hypothetical protein
MTIDLVSSQPKLTYIIYGSQARLIFGDRECFSNSQNHKVNTGDSTFRWIKWNHCLKLAEISLAAWLNVEAAFAHKSPHASSREYILQRESSGRILAYWSATITASNAVRLCVEL